MMHFRAGRLLNVAAVSTVLLSIGCSKGRAASSADERPREAAAVTIAAEPVVRRRMPSTLEVIGTAEPYSTVAVHAQLTGELTSVSFKDGDDVSKGQVLFTLDRRSLEAALAQANANLERDKAQLTNAAGQLKRYQDLADRGIATREQLDQSRTNVAALDATIAADQAAIENARVQLAYATISSPISGRTGRLMVNVGNLIRANDATPLVVINQVSPIYVTFAVPQDQLPVLRRHAARGPLHVEARASNDDRLAGAGTVSFIDNAINQLTGTIAVRGTFPNSDRALWPGEFVNVVVTLDIDKDALVVPTTAVQDSQQGKFVFVVKDDHTVERRSIEIVRSAGAQTILASGVVEGETVVTDGQIRLVPGSRVTVRSRQESESGS